MRGRRRDAGTPSASASHGPGGFCTIDVDDCAEGHVLAKEKGRVGERYILGNDNVSLKDFLEIVCKVAGLKAPKIPMPGALAASVALGMELWPTRRLEETVRRAVDWSRGDFARAQVKAK